MNDHYEVILRDTGEAVRPHWTIKEDRLVRVASKVLTYCALNRRGDTAESSGPGSAVDGGRDPVSCAQKRAVDSTVFHQLERRVKAHVMLALLSMVCGSL